MRSEIGIGCILLVLAGACAAPQTPAVQQATTAQSAKSPFREADGHFQAGRYAEAAKAYASALAADPSHGQAWFQYGYALHASGQLERALEAHERATAFPAFAPVAAYNLGCAHALLGHPEEAFAALERARGYGFRDLAQLDGDADLASLHADPRWEKLRAKLGAAASDPTLRQMDFWVGDWVVATESGAKLGENRITSQLNGNLIFEEWTGISGGSGKSINYYDRDAKQWKQVWIDAGGGLLQMAGEFRDGALRFTGKHQYPGGASVEHRTTLTPLPASPDASAPRVRQVIEESKDGGATWRQSFEGLYSPKSGA